MTALRRRIGTATALLLVAGAALAEDVRLSGTGSALGTFQRLSAAFAKASPGDRLRILPSVGSSGAISAVAKGALDVGVSGRPLGAAEQALGVVAIPYARTPLLFAVGPRAGVRDLRTGDLVRIYRGELAAWPNGERVRVVMRPRTDVDNALLRGISPEVSAALDAAFARPGLLVALTNQECDDILARTPGAIGPTSLTQVITEEEHVVPLSWNGVEPTVSNLASGAYPLSKTLFVVTRTPPPARAARLLAFLRSAEASRILEDTGNLPIPIAAPGGHDADGR